MPAAANKALDDLAVFVVVARHESFVEAARRSGMPTSSVSRAVARLEEELGVRLLQRTSRNVVLTSEGRALLRDAAPHVDGLREALAATAERRPEPSGLVRVTAPAYTGATRIARALAAFARAYPRIVVELDASNALRDLVEDRFDLGIRVGPVVDADFVARRIWQGRMGLFAANEVVESALGGRAVVTREALEREPCVVMRPNVSWRFRDASGKVSEVKPRARFAVNDPRATLDVARRGLGLVLAPIDAAAADPDGLVALTCELGEPEPVDLYLVYPSRRLLPQRVRLAIDWLSQLD